MIRILLYIALLFAVAAGFAWLADRPGVIALTWQGYEIRTTLMVAAVAMAVLFVLIAIVLSLLLAFVRAPSLLGDWVSGRRRDRGYRALSRGMIAIGTGDGRRARRYAAEANRILAGEPLTLLLTAQTAQLAGDGTGARAAFETMLADPETRLLGLRGLYVEAERAGETEAARHFAEQAVQAAPGLAWAGNALFRYQAAASDWRGALLTLGSNLQAKLIDRTTAHRLRAVLLTARGLSLETPQPDEAKALALEAVKLAPDLVPAATLAGRLLAREGDVKRASRLLEAAWKQVPHPEIAEAYARVRPGDAALDRLKRAQKLAALRPNAVESQYALTRAAIDARDFAEARHALGVIDAAGRTERFYLLMAEIEEGDEGDRGRMREWLGRAMRARRDPVWMADGYVFGAWAAVSPVSGRLDAFEWRVPTLALAEERGPAIDLAPALPPEEPPAIEAQPASPAPSVASAEAVAPKPPVAPGQTAEPRRPASRRSSIAMPPVPDDPGIDDGAATRLDPLRLQ